MLLFVSPDSIFPFSHSTSTSGEAIKLDEKKITAKNAKKTI
jgi:hypothetical protein